MKYFALLKGFAILAVIIIVISTRFSGRKSGFAKLEEARAKNAQPAEISKLRGTVTGVRLADGRLYAELESRNGDRFWVATAEQPLEKGMIVAFELSVPQRDFTTKGLGRILPLVYFTRHLIIEDAGASREA